jgi:hypothetical protein
MANMTRRDSAPLSLLDIHFGARADVAQKLVDVVEAAPERIWPAADIISAAKVEPVEGYMFLARLTVIGAIAHPDLGTYAAADAEAKGKIA